MKLIFGLLLLMPFFALSQQADSTAIEFTKPQINLKIDVTGLLNPFYKSSGIGADYFINDKIFLQAEVGYFFHSAQLSNQKGELYQGLKTQLGANYVINWRKKDCFYVGVLLNNRFITNKQYKEDLIQEQFVEIKLTERKVTSIGGNIIIGNQWYLGQAKKVFIEWYFGLGAKLNWVKNIDNVSCNFCINDGMQPIFDLELNEGTGFTPDAYLFGLNMGFNLK